MTVRVAEPPPGEAAQVDFGLLGLLSDPLTDALIPPAAADGRATDYPAQRAAYAMLQDEIDRWDSQGLARRIDAAGFEEVVTYEHFVWDTGELRPRPRE